MIMFFLVGCSSADPDIETVRNSFVDDLETTTIANVLEGRSACRSFRWHKWADSKDRSIIESKCVLDLPDDPLAEHRRGVGTSTERHKANLESAEGRLRVTQEDLDRTIESGSNPGFILARERAVIEAKDALLLAREKHEAAASNEEVTAHFHYPVVDAVIEITQWIIGGDGNVHPISVAIIGERAHKEDIYLGGSPWVFDPLSANIQSRIDQTVNQIFGWRGYVRSWPSDSAESILERHYRLN